MLLSLKQGVKNTSYTGMKQQMLFDLVLKPQSETQKQFEDVVYCGSAQKVLKTLPDNTIASCITSPPYWGLRDYGVNEQIGAEFNLNDYINHLVDIFREIRRVLKEDGTLWLNIGDSYTSGGRTWRDADKKNPARGMDYRPPTPDGLKPKDLIGVPWKLAFALQTDGWYLRSDIIWHKPNCQPESVKDRPTRSHEYVFLFSKSEKYYYDSDAIKEDSVTGTKKNRRSVWSINTEPFNGAHFATFPENLVLPCLMASSKKNDVVIDPFFGSGTVGSVATKNNRNFIGIEINPDYIDIAKLRLKNNNFTVRNI